MIIWPEMPVLSLDRSVRPRRGWRSLLLGKVLAGWVAGASLASAQAPVDAKPTSRVGQPTVPAIEQPAEPPAPLNQPRLAPPGIGRLEHLPFKGLGTAPAPDPEVLRRYSKYVQEFKDSQATLDLIEGRTRLMVLTTTPTRIQVADENVASYTLLTPRQISVMGKKTGVTVLTLWFTDPLTKAEEILTYHVRAAPDPEARIRIEGVYKALADEINRAFPNSVITLQLVGEKLIVGGHAKDVAEATKILQIIRTNAPAPPGREVVPAAARVPVDAGGRPLSPTAPVLENYQLSGEAFVVNMLQINGEQQVMLRVTVAEVNRAAARSIGVNFAYATPSWGIANNTGGIANGGGAFGNLLGFNPGGGNNPGPLNNILIRADNGQLQVAISALKVLQYARSLAEPSLTTLNGQTAHFHAGGQYPVPVIVGGNNVNQGVQGVNYIPFGVQLHFTPTITDRDRVNLVMEADISTPSFTAGNLNLGGGANVPAFATRTVRTVVELREGQTLAVAGLVQQSISADGRRIPLIGELPVISRLLGLDRTTSSEQELVILVTPELVHPLDCNEHLPLPGHDIFEPGDCEFYLLGRLESHICADYRTAVRTDCTRLKMARQVESLFVSGPTGHDCEPPWNRPLAPHIEKAANAVPVPAGPAPKTLPPKR